MQRDFGLQTFIVDKFEPKLYLFLCFCLCLDVVGF